ncbi:hypothetical protein EDB92DRAFT_1889909 [Lactarius akahatsu]|uniref:Uncharacterized protein n=1 Tax=Lactarius akahatsu TaxID=416441 RepID=A0AAD4LE42_9AGAM|nr:hypothetical protein EDB92DRAFT_1889909 [Lactarius akahatsu]
MQTPRRSNSLATKQRHVPPTTPSLLNSEACHTTFIYASSASPPPFGHLIPDTHRRDRRFFSAYSIMAGIYWIHALVYRIFPGLSKCHSSSSSIIFHNDHSIMRKATSAFLPYDKLHPMRAPETIPAYRCRHAISHPSLSPSPSLYLFSFRSPSRPLNYKHDIGSKREVSRQDHQASISLRPEHPLRVKIESRLCSMRAHSTIQ